MKYAFLVLSLSLVTISASAAPIPSNLKRTVCREIYRYYGERPSNEVLAQCMTGNFVPMESLSRLRIMYSGGILPDGAGCMVEFDKNTRRVTRTSCGE